MKKKIKRTLLKLAEKRAPLTVCPSEVARALAADWRPLMPHVRAAARELIERGEMQCLQRGEVVAIENASGPIRLRRRG
ncbi:MAG: DUF3253 domain-containing protein [Verrucomicrobiota bacterium]